MIALAILALAYVLSHFYRSFLAVLAPVLEAELGIGPAALSQASGAWFVAFAFSQFLVGPMLDRLGPRVTAASLFGVVGGGGALWLAMSQSSASLTGAMIALGIGCSPVLMASLYLFKRTFEPRRFAVLTSTFIGVGLFGNLLGSAPLAWAAAAFGWRGVMLALAATTIALAILIALTVRNPPAAEGGSGSGLGGYLELMRMRQLWPIMALSLVAYAVAGGLRGSWAGPYLADLGLGTVEIGNVVLAMAVAMTIGSFAYGPLDTVFDSRKWVAFGGNAIVFVALLVWWLTPEPTVWSVGASLVAVGLFGMTFAVVMAHGTATIPDRLAGRGVTLMNFFNIGGVGLLQFVTSRAFEATGGETDPSSAYSAVLLVYLSCLGVALVIYATSRDAPPSRAGQLA